MSRARVGLASTTLAAALVVPWLFAPFTDRVFEAEKTAALRALAVPILVLAAAIAAPGGRAAIAARWRAAGAGARGVVAAGLGLWFVDGLATLTSRAPWLSLLGSDDRGFGWLTTTALVLLAAGAATLVATPGGGARLAAFVGASALPPALYGLFQRAGADPLPWLGDVVTRVSGSAGASVMLGAHLVAAVPFAALATAAAWRAVAAGGRWAQARLAAWLVIDAVAVAALALSGSRGPALAAVAAVVVAALAAAARGRRRGTALAVAAAAALAVGGLVALNARPAAFGPLLRLELVARLSEAFDPQRSTTRVRLRLWEGSAAAIADLGGRAWLGHGPETMPLAWAPYYPSILAYDEPRGWVPDRAHNLWLDRWLTTGALGAAAMLAVVVAALAAAASRLGLLERRGDALRATAAWLGAGASAAAVARAVDGAWRLAAPAFGLGLVAGLAIWFVACAWRRRQPSPLAPADGLALAVLASLAAFTVETQVGFPIAASALVVALGVGAMVSTGAPRPSDADGAPPDGDAGPPADGAFGAGVVAVTGLYAFGRAGLVGPGAVGAVVLVALASIIVGLALGGGSDRRATARIGAVVAATVVAHAAALRLGTDGPSDAVPAAALSLAVLALAVTVLVVVHAAAPTPRAKAGDAPPVASASAAAAAAVALVGVVACLAPTVADALAKEGRVAWERQVSDWRARGDLGRAGALLDGAERRYRLAAALVPWSPRYRLALGMAADVRGDLLTEALVAEAARGGAAAEATAAESATGAPVGDLTNRRDAAFEAAVGHFAAAGRLAPGDPTAALAAARAWRIWGDLTDAPAQRAARLAEARRAYAAARALAPHWPEVLSESATVELLDGRPAAALALAEAAMALDGFYYQGWKTVAAARTAAGDAAGAADAWRRYFDDPRNAGDVAALRARTAAELQAGHAAAALASARAVVRLAPEDARAAADLAVALARDGRAAEALAAAERAAALNPADAGIRALVANLRAGRTP